jgi:hypothetical protein
VDPANTSRTCPVCGHVDKRNRRSQSEFRCRRCGHAGPADVIAARNIRAWRMAMRRWSRPKGQRQVPTLRLGDNRLLRCTPEGHPKEARVTAIGRPTGGSRGIGRQR